MTDDPQSLRRLITQKYKFAESGDYFGLLGVDSNASPESIRKAYFALAKNLHPDKVGRMGLDDVKPKAAKLFSLVTEAYTTLSDSQKRAEYESGALKASTTNINSVQATEAATAKLETAKIAYHKGSVMLQKRAYREAERYFREATEANEKIARYWQSLGWAIFNAQDARSEDERLEGAKTAYEHALEIDSEDSQTHYNLGLYWKAKSDSRRMRRSMEKAIKFNKDHINARRELRLLEMRQGKLESSAKGGGFFASLWQSLTKKR